MLGTNANGTCKNNTLIFDGVPDELAQAAALWGDFTRELASKFWRPMGLYFTGAFYFVVGALLCEFEIFLLKSEANELVMLCKAHMEIMMIMMMGTP